MDQALINLSESRWRVLQPAIYLVSVLPVLVCGFIVETDLSLVHLMVMGAGVVLIQHAINVFNDQTDWEKGADAEKQNSWYHFHQGDGLALRRHAWASFILGVGLGIWVVAQTGRWGVLWTALPLLSLGFFYNHTRWTLSYTQWGEWVTGLCYGPGVFGCMVYVLTGHLSKELILGAVAFSSLAVAVLLSHQPPQVLTDFAAGKNSFAVRYGTETTYTASRNLMRASLFFITLLFSGSGDSLLKVGIPWVLFCAINLRLPKKVSPSIILRTVTLQILTLGFLLKESWI